MKPRGQTGQSLIALAMAALISVGAAVAQTEIQKLGPQVGERAIAFQLNDQFGRPQTLDSLAGPNGTMLVFFRSADW